MNQPKQMIGKWTCPSGNQVDAVLEGNGTDVNFYWDVAPPLTPEDQEYYTKVIMPQVIMKTLSQRQK